MRTLAALIPLALAAVLLASACGDGGPAATATPTATVASLPAATGKIAFMSTRDGHYEVYSMDIDGANQTNLTNSPADNFNPAWSPDGTAIAFASERDGNREIYVMDADGANQTNLTNSPADDFHPAWSPDGTAIAFASERDDNYEIYVMDADGANRARLTSHPATDWTPTWSPDGTAIRRRRRPDQAHH
jgi:Tol biopolymer transport system component